MLKKINRVFLKHRCLFLQERRLVKRLSCTNKHRCLRKAWFISLSTSPKHLPLYKALLNLSHPTHHTYYIPHFQFTKMNICLHYQEYLGPLIHHQLQDDTAILWSLEDNEQKITASSLYYEVKPTRLDPSIQKKLNLSPTKVEREKSTYFHDIFQQLVSLAIR